MVQAGWLGEPVAGRLTQVVGGRPGHELMPDGRRDLARLKRLLHLLLLLWRLLACPAAQFGFLTDDRFM